MINDRPRAFLGLPITGTAEDDTDWVAQRPLEELAPLFSQVLNSDVIQSFGWSQDIARDPGEPNSFMVMSLWVRTAEDGDRDPEDLQVEFCEHPTLGKIEDTYEGDFGHRTLVESRYIGNGHESTLRACFALSEAFKSHAFDEVLRQHFGLQATVTITREGITIAPKEDDDQDGLDAW